MYLVYMLYFCKTMANAPIQSGSSMGLSETRLVRRVPARLAFALVHQWKAKIGEFSWLMAFWKVEGARL